MKCPDCKRDKSSYEVKVKTEIKQYWICWSCYDARKDDNTKKQWIAANRRSRIRTAKARSEIYA